MPFEVSWMATGVSGPRAVPQTEMMDPGASPRPNIEKGKSLAASVMPAIVGTGAVTVRVIDHGRGIPSQLRARVFEPFFRGRRGAGSGPGLGLAICRGFVEANGGRIVLQSEAERGTSFAVSFPLEHQPAPSGLGR